MKRLETVIPYLSDDQARFVRLCIQRFEHDHQGVVKTRLALPNPKKKGSERSRAGTVALHESHSDTHNHGFLDQLTHATTEQEVITAIGKLSDGHAQRLAAAQGLRNDTPAQARMNLMETVMTLREMSRIQNAGKAPETP